MADEGISVLLAPGIFPPDSGGPATFAPQLGSNLVATGHDVRVVTNGTAPEGFDEQFSFEVVRIRRRTNVLARYGSQIATLRREVKAFDPDVVLCNAFDLQTVAATRGLGIPVVTKVVGDNAWERARRSGRVTDDIDTFQQERYSPTVTFLKALRTLQTRGADHVIVPSEYLSSLVTGWGVSREDVSVIYNAIDVDPPGPPDSGRTPKITTVCRLVPWKGVAGLIEAVETLGPRVPDAELHVVGDGPERDRLERSAARTDVADRVTFHGSVAHDRVLELLSESQVFALNSTYEGLPHVVLEAMTCGTPVVASKAGGTPEAIEDGDSGFLVEQNDTEAFADRFDRLLTDRSLRESCREGAYRLLEERFDYETMLESYEHRLIEVATDE